MAKVSEQVNRKCYPRNMISQLLTLMPTLSAQTPYFQHLKIYMSGIAVVSMLMKAIPDLVFMNTSACLL